MTKKMTRRDWEAISAYIDNELSAKERRRVEARLDAEPELRRLMVGLRETRSLVRSLERVRAPRNFTLTPEMAGVTQRRRSPAPVFQWASALATFLFVLVIAGDFFGAFRPPQALTDAGILEAASPTLTSAMQLEALQLEAAPLPEGETFADAGEAPAAADEEPAEEPAEERMAVKAPETPAPAEAFGGAIEPAPEEPPSTAETVVTQELLAQAETAAPEETELPVEIEQEALVVEDDAPTSLGILRLRLIEVGLAAFALITGLAAWLFRRRPV